MKVGKAGWRGVGKGGWGGGGEGWGELGFLYFKDHLKDPIDVPWTHTDMQNTIGNHEPSCSLSEVCSAVLCGVYVACALCGEILTMP